MPVDLAVEVVVAIDQADDFYLGAYFEHSGGTFDLQVFGHGGVVAIGEQVAVGIAYRQCVVCARIVRAG